MSLRFPLGCQTKSAWASGLGDSDSISRRWVAGSREHQVQLPASLLRSVADYFQGVAVLQLWWGITEQTYLYYWHHRVWSILAVWAVVALIVVLIVLIGEELWRAGYRSALRSVSVADTPPDSPPRSVQPKGSSTSTGDRRFLAPPSQAFPGIRRAFSRRDDGQDVSD